ncbi:MAG TPA: hypothetical protein VHC63_02045 [Acidimicrobiales bacterium]|nr:hypothetical protein [Acidimicrobiales bacterium]
MTLLQTSTIDELCHTLGLRAPYPVGEPNVDALSDDHLTALSVLASPEAIAVVTRWRAQHVIATRGGWLAEHVIEGDTHHLRAAPVEDAPSLLLDRCGLLDDADEPGAEYVDVAVAGYRRMHELLRTGDVRRARATLVADGARPASADAFVAAARAGITEVAGLGTDGRRFTGCELAFAGDASTGRWLVPGTQHVDPLPRGAFRHPSLRNVRVLLERVGTAELIEELGLIFG